MRTNHFLRAVAKALAAPKNGPTLYDVCGPLLRRPGKGDAHLQRFYRTALANVALRPLLARAGAPPLADPARMRVLQEALLSARDEPQPDWAAIAQPVGRLLDEAPHTHSQRARAPAPPMPPLGEIERVLRGCAEHLLRSFRRNGFLPAYAAFNLAGDPDLHGRDLSTALAGLNARSHRNATLLFNLARVFVLANRPLHDLVNPSFCGVAEPLWAPVQIRHRSAYYDAFFAEALMDFMNSGLAHAPEVAEAERAVKTMIDFCLGPSSEPALRPCDGRRVAVVTAIAPSPHARISRFFGDLTNNLGFGVYVHDLDTTACAFSAATQAGVDHPILDEPFPDFFAGYQLGQGAERFPVTVAINDAVAFDGGVVTWIENAAGELPFGNDLDPTLNLDLLEVTFRNHRRWGVAETPERLAVLQRIVRFQDNLTRSGAFADPRSHLFYLPELYSAYFGRCYAAFRALPPALQTAIDPEDAFERIRGRVLAYVYDELIAFEMNPFDAALALLAIAKLAGEPGRCAPALDCIIRRCGEGGSRAPFKAYEWTKVKIPTRILVGGAEVTSAFVLSGLVHARAYLQRQGAA